MFRACVQDLENGKDSSKNGIPYKKIAQYYNSEEYESKYISESVIYFDDFPEWLLDMIGIEFVVIRSVIYMCIDVHVCIYIHSI